jgi:small-conductance mechanosensitive channel
MRVFLPVIAVRRQRERTDRRLTLSALAGLLCAAVLSLAAAGEAAAQGSSGKGATTTALVFPLDSEPHATLPDPGRPVWRDTPQATAESLLDAAAAEDALAAAYTLDLSPVPEEFRLERGPELAMKLARILEERSLIDWSRLPDRPDGLMEPPINANNPMLGVPRRAITLATLELDGRDAPITLMRMQPAEGPPVWLFSATTVRHIERLDELRTDSPLTDYVPESWREQELLGMPLWKWLAGAGLAVLSLAIGRVLSRLLRRLLTRLTDPGLRNLLRKGTWPVTIALSLLIWWAASRILVDPTGTIALVLGNLVVLGIIGSLTWLAARVVDHLTGELGRRFEDRAAIEDEGDARQLLTQLSIGRRVVVLLAVTLGFGIALSYFDIFRTLGLSLLFSAGALSVVLGIAANALLRNFLAGLQIGFAQPLRVGDTVTLSGHYGYVEDIGSVFLTMRTWDSRRLIIPYNVLLQQPIENWSKGGAFVIRHVDLTVDFAVDLDALREALRQAVGDSEDAEPNYEPSILVMGSNAESLQIWALVGAPTPAKAWTLEVFVRERLLKEVLRQGALPRERVQALDAEEAADRRAVAEQEGQPGDDDGPRSPPEFERGADPGT